MPRVLLMVHGNPTWSFYYRNLVLQPARPLPLHRARTTSAAACRTSPDDAHYDYHLEPAYRRPGCAGRRHDR